MLSVYRTKNNNCWSDWWIIQSFFFAFFLFAKIKIIRFKIRSRSPFIPESTIRLNWPRRIFSRFKIYRKSSGQIDGSKASLPEWRKIGQLSGALPCKGRQVFSKRKSSRPKVSRKVVLEKPCQGGNFARIVATFVCLKITRERNIFPR